MANVNVDHVPLSNGDTGILRDQDAVRKTAQSLTDSEKATARTNIGAASAAELTTLNNNAIKKTAQTLTDAEKAQARTNIGAESSAKEELTINRIENAFITETNLNRCKAYRKGGMLYFSGNMQLTAGTTSDFTQIASISGWSALSDAYITVPCQNDLSSAIVLQIMSNGTVRIYSGQGVRSGYYRLFICAPSKSG